MQPSLILFAVFASVTLLVVGVFFLFSGRSDRADRRLRVRLNRLTQVAHQTSEEKPGRPSIFREEFIRGSPILILLRGAFPGGLSDLGLRLERAGIAMGPNRFAKIWALVILLGGFTGWVLSPGAGGMFLGLLFGGVPPFIFLNLKTRVRERAFERQFPEALRLLSTSLKAGHALPAGIRMLSEELPPPVSLEFGRVSEESGLGLRIEDALENMIRRMNNQDLRFFVTSVMIQRETGGNLSDVLEQLDALIRERFKIRRQVKALTAPGRFAGLLLGVMPIGVGLVFSLLNPTYMSPLWETPTGRAMAIGGFVLQVVGYLLIRRIVNIKI